MESHPHHHHSSSLHRVITRRAVLSAAVGSAGAALLAACGTQGTKGHFCLSGGRSSECGVIARVFALSGE